jgi:penicillin-binding protein 1A
LVADCYIPRVRWRPSSPEAARVEITNPSDGGFWFWLFKFYGFAALCLAGFAVLAGIALYAYFASTLPSLPDFDRYRQDTAESTRVPAWDGTTLAELASERREILPLEAFPKNLPRAFVAIEDRRFYEHSGLDYRGMLRALVANLRAGHVVQGGSTITQQVARAFLRSSEQTLQRKIREAILARRLEASYAKDQILTLYLNQIFLGHQSYGVAAAARRYFNKQVSDLDVAEMATIAGIAQAPSRYSPLLAPDLTRARRDQVLAAMVTAGVIDEATADNLRARPLTVRQPPDVFRERSPYFAEHIRRDIARRYGEKALWEGGLEIETTLVPWIDEAAQENVDFSLRKLDKRQGWRGPVARLGGPAAEEFRRRASARYGASRPVEGRLYLGLVESTSGGKGAQVRVGEKTYLLPSSEMEWAYPYSTTDSTNGKTLSSTAGVLHAGDVVWVTPAFASRVRRFSDWTYDSAGEVQWIPASPDRKLPSGPATLRLDQTPRVQGSLFSYDHQTGYVQTMVGGLDFDRSEFNRVVQACRQPGSTYKPIYYSLALDRGYGYASLLNDTPRAEVDPITGEVWIPQNLNNTVEYQVNLEYALIWSKNVPSVQLFKLVGGKDVEAWARRLGITTPIIPDQALALGASCTRIDELTRAFSAFARNGSLSNPVYVRRVRDRAGQVLEDSTVVSDPMGAPDLRLDRMVALAGKRVINVIPPRTAWLTSQLLRHVVTKGHAPALRSSGLLIAGKTGTSSATMDTWFVGYTSRWMTTSWIGDDRRERPLGFKDAAFMLTVPMIARYLHEVTAGQPLQDVPWDRPPGVKATDTGGTLRTTMEEVKADDQPGKKTKG